MITVTQSPPMSANPDAAKTENQQDLSHHKCNESGQRIELCAKLATKSGAIEKLLSFDRHFQDIAI